MLSAMFQGIKEARAMCELCDVEVEDTASLDTVLRRLSKAMIQRMKSNQKSDLKVMSRPEGIEEM